MKRLFSMILVLAVALSALQAQNTVTVGDVELKKGNSVLVSVELTNELAFSAFQMDLALPEGFSIPTTMNEDEEEVLDITLNASRKKSTHQLVYNVLNDGTVRIGSYSTTNATFKGTSGEIVQFRIVAADETETGNYTATLDQLLFSTSEPAVEYDLGTVEFQITYTKGEEDELLNHSVTVSAGKYGRCILDGQVVEPEGSYTLSSGIEHGATVKMFFVPFDGYQVSSLKRNGEEVAVKDNMYEEAIVEDVVFTDVKYVVAADTVVVEKTDTIFITGVEELPTPVITCDNGVVTITCEQEDAIILYAINGDPIEGGVYVAPFEVTGDAVVSAVAVRSSEQAELDVTGTSVAQSQMRIVSRRYYAENGIRVVSPEAGVTIVVAEYEDGSTQVYKLVKK